ncbi:multidrug effflux MFS transporter [Microbacterium xanthum]|uniref:multidrug effflux MFS transporter n=1 Tax=Microbacterium xanthum TaxID=3079794 RepID=UPI002AD3A91C|nr:MULTISPECIES: multidrug effflux MFS transporter [unclassified Microbacterium]MDZ8171757.1 multidrug effflux MFS transporter [Microbacterium sp. KSW-48]MDZ8200140.1 multidrug effflux MFS transporter [Microbacterium sp. SSW1-59]
MTPARRLTPGLLATLGFLAAVAPFATDMYLASFTDIAADLGSSASAVQLTLTAFLLGIGAGQLALGPLSDRFGRRPVMVAAMGVFAAAGVLMVFTPTIEVFVALRLLQGFSGAAGIVVARAIAVDLSTGETAVRALSLIATVTALGPLIAPPIGGAVAVLAGWRGVLIALAAVSATMFLLALWVVPESLPPARRHAGGARAVGGLLATAARTRGFIGYTLTVATGFAAMMAYISASPFVGQEVLGMDPFLYALGFAVGALGIVSANLLNARIAPRVGPGRMLTFGVGLLLFAGAAIGLLVAAEWLTPASFIACALVLTAGAGFTMSNGSALALARTPTIRGSGAAVLGATQFLIGGATSPVVGAWGEDTAVPMAVVIAVAATLAAVFRLVAWRRVGGAA